MVSSLITVFYITVCETGAHGMFVKIKVEFNAGILFTMSFKNILSLPICVCMPVPGVLNPKQVKRLPVQPININAWV